MATRRFHGILDFEYGTAAALASDGDGTSVNDIIGESGAEGGENSRIEFPEEEGSPLDAFGNRIAGAQYARFVIKAIDLTAFAAIRANWLAGTRQYFAADLDNGERVYTTVPVNLEYIRPVTITGRKQGSAAAFEMAFRIPFDDLTFV